MGVRARSTELAAGAPLSGHRDLTLIWAWSRQFLTAPHAMLNRGGGVNHRGFQASAICFLDLVSVFIVLQIK